MRGPLFNRYRLKMKMDQLKYQCRYWGYRAKEGARQIFIPLAIFQLVRTIFFPTPFDVFLLVLIFLVIVIFLLDWM
ncbi:hypothetical protein [Caldalkalibacillus mannanilyticus]|uniref:hypothetical protein n=1 Tax=Caldalkalibacillus mannanilyticus TaxID=1418 RepID=UPI000B1397F8|nr:hypothetical protein [Caldalkalibacillus mannanilyticus]